MFAVRCDSLNHEDRGHLVAIRRNWEGAWERARELAAKEHREAREDGPHYGYLAREPFLRTRKDEGRGWVVEVGFAAQDGTGREYLLTTHYVTGFDDHDYPE